MTERDAYEVLQVDPRAEREVVSAAYRALARLFHPDGDSPDPRRMAEVNRAYDRLKTPDLRAAYDRERRSPPVAVGPGRSGVYDAWPDRAQPSTASAEEPEILDFGRYEGWRIADLAHHDPDYLRWLSRHSSGVRFREAIARALPGDGAIGRKPSWVA